MSTSTPPPAGCEDSSSSAASQPAYKVYKRRFWGLAQLVLLNIVVSWDVGHSIPRILRKVTMCDHVLTMIYR